MKNLDLGSLLAMPELESYTAQIKDQLLLAVQTDNQQLKGSLEQIVSADAKRLRPILLIASAASNGGKISVHTLRACAAIELIHLGSLVHDDLIDNAKTRHNLPTVNKAQGSGQAVIVGDFLLARASYLAAGIGPDAAQLLADAVTSLCDGQSRELADQYNVGRTTSSLLRAINGKTASLISAACKLGGLCGGLNMKQQLSLASYGTAFGMAYQLIDDILDVLSSDKLYRKPVMVDINQGIYTLPLIKTWQATSDKKLKPKLSKNTKISQDYLAAFLLSGDGINQTINLVKHYNEEAARSLEEFGSTPIVEGLRALPARYLEWAFGNLITEPYTGAARPLLKDS